MIGKPGPFEIIKNEEGPSGNEGLSTPRRRYACANYETCLDLAAALNWDNFTCRGCSGEINQALYWRARQAMKKDRVVRTLCEIPEIEFHNGQEPAEEKKEGQKLIAES